MEMEARVKVLLTPLGNTIKYQLVGRIYCFKMRKELRNSGTYDKDDLAWLSVFGSELSIARFLKRNKRISKVLSLYDLGYEQCDRLVPPKHRH